MSKIEIVRRTHSCESTRYTKDIRALVCRSRNRTRLHGQFHVKSIHTDTVTRPRRLVQTNKNERGRKIISVKVEIVNLRVVASRESRTKIIML